MGKKVLIISSSPIKTGNSALLCEEFARGAKVFIDRFIAGEVYMRKHGEGKTAYLITVSASPDVEENHLAANASFRGFLTCLQSVKEGGILNAGGAYAPGSIRDQDWMRQAYEMGKGINHE